MTECHQNVYIIYNTRSVTSISVCLNSKGMSEKLCLFTHSTSTIELEFLYTSYRDGRSTYC